MAFLDRYTERVELSLTRREIGIAVAIAVLTAVLLGAILGAQQTLFSTDTPTPNELAAGKPSPVTILAPARTTFVSELETQSAREQAAAQVPDIYDPPDANVAREQVRRATRLVEFMDTVRADAYAAHSDKVEWVQAFPEIQVSGEVISRTLALDEPGYRQVMSETLYVIDAGMRDEIRARDLTAARQKNCNTHFARVVGGPSGFGPAVGPAVYCGQCKTECRENRTRENASARSGGCGVSHVGTGTGGCTRG